MVFWDIPKQSESFLKIVNWIRYDKIVGFPIARLDYLINAGKGSEEAALVRISVDLSGDMR